MNGCAGEYSLRAKARLIGARLFGAVCAALVATAAAAQPPWSGAGYPTFASVPAAPKDVRPVAAWRTAVVETRITGARLTRAAAKEPWTLDDTVGWAARERNEARPPAQITQPSEPDVDAMVKAMKARASQPSRRR